MRKQHVPRIKKLVATSENAADVEPRVKLLVAGWSYFKDFVALHTKQPRHREIAWEEACFPDAVRRYEKVALVRLARRGVFLGHITLPHVRDVVLVYASNL
eukprot:TRINITY_DN2023_c1_g2_i1.p2 TRINITY_DN2023_c1_g2~~TRINITY_DN2023_c1_g2_i1.p2  ORF type:complete len:101 (-),score=4.85 TRINITY_DN2023_c1_g2_i1:299-601(-)